MATHLLLISRALSDTHHAIVPVVEMNDGDDALVAAIPAELPAPRPAAAIVAGVNIRRKDGDCCACRTILLPIII
jgi:hypothetical protein